MSGLNNLQIDSICRTHKHTRDYYEGCYCIDTLSTYKIQYPSFIICNTDNSWSGGQHWLYLAFPGKYSTNEIFDSLGQPLSMYDPIFQTILTEYGNGDYIVNTQRYQSPESDACGYYCLWMGDMRSMNIPYSKCLSLLNSETLSQNDDYVTSYVMQHMGLNRSV